MPMGSPRRTAVVKTRRLPAPLPVDHGYGYQNKARSEASDTRESFYSKQAPDFIFSLSERCEIDGKSCELTLA